jgi:hypothetical protein
MKFIASLLIAAGAAFAQDPADGWMAYAVGAIPSKFERITHLEMTWVVSNDPGPTNAFYSPWFGMDPADNLNLIQPVNPWLGNGWVGYTEYFQWSPEDNSNSRQISVKAGQTLHGVLAYDSSKDAYKLTQTVKETGETSSQVVRCQGGKKYKIPYVVYEKVWPCDSYPSDGKVLFTDIKAECDNTECTKDIQWSAKVKDANCNMAAHINSDGTISITWDTSMASKYDNMTATELFDRNYKGWATREELGLKRPAETVTVDTEWAKNFQANNQISENQ